MASPAARPAPPELDARHFANLRWRCIGPFRGGRVVAVTGVPGEPNHFYFGSVGGGVWETHNAGRTWTPIFDSQPVASIGAIAVAPSDPKRIYVGSGEADMRSQVSYGNGMYVSADGGRTWTHAGLEDSQQIGRIAVDPRDPKVAYVAVLGHAYASNPTRGLYRTADAGRTWTRVLSENDDTGAIEVVIDPANPDIVLAAMWQTRRPPWNVYPPSNGPGSGLFRSEDGGRHWSKIANSGLPSAVGRIGVAFAPSRAGRVYAIVDAKEGGLYRSEDGGRSWSHRSGDPRIWQRGWYFGGVAADSRNADVVYVCDTAMYRSTDGGTTFLPWKGSPGGDDYHQLWIDPGAPERMIAGVDQGAIVTVDGGATWSSWYNQPIAQLYHVSTDSSFPYRVYGAQQDSGAARVPSRSDWEGILPFDWRPVDVGYENGYIAPDPLDPRTVYGAGVTRFDGETLQNRDVNPERAYPDSYRHTWTLPLVFSRRNPKVLYYSNQRLFRTEDRGEHWEPISPDLSREDPGVPGSLDPATAKDSPRAGPRRGVIYTIAPSYLRDGEIWCGTDDGLIWRTRDEGKHWDDVTPKGLSAWSKISMLEASRHDANVLYASVDRHRLDDFRPHVFATRDGGKSWRETTAGIPGGAFVHVVREDPVRAGLLYAGTELGVFVSFDAGERWQPMGFNLPVCSVRDIDVHGADLVLATHGRSFWILDDVSPLRQVTPVVLRSVAELFSPEPAYRIHPARFQGTPVPKDEPIGENPARGAVIDYWLAARSATPVVVEIRNSRGEALRTFSSADSVRMPNASKAAVTLDWESPPAPPSAEAGMHRFVWDLQMAVPPELVDPDDEFLPEGLRVPPGRYSVRLEAAGRSIERPLEVRTDPRVHVSAEELVESFELSRKVERERVLLAKARHEAEAALRAATSAAEKEKISAILGSVDLQSMYATGGEPGTLQWAAWSLRGIAGILESADAGPSVDDRKAVELRLADAHRALEAWKSRSGRSTSPTRTEPTSG
jgi:photosystem II stability/assembly factor-like uncharacterized protein